MRKGQIVTVDFVPALVIFLVLFTGMSLAWNNFASQANEIAAYNEMKRSVTAAADALVRHGGHPPDWTSTSVTLPGLSEGRPNILSAAKVSSLLNTNYSSAKRLLGIPYEFRLEINRTGGAFSIGGNETVYGQSPTNATTVVVVRRLILLQGEAGTLTMKVWS